MRKYAKRPTVFWYPDYYEKKRQSNSSHRWLFGYSSWTSWFNRPSVYWQICYGVVRWTNDSFCNRIWAIEFTSYMYNCLVLTQYWEAFTGRLPVMTVFFHGIPSRVICSDTVYYIQKTTGSCRWYIQWCYQITSHVSIGLQVAWSSMEMIFLIYKQRWQWLH